MSETLRVHPKLKPYFSVLAAYEFGLQGLRAEIRNAENGGSYLDRDRDSQHRFSLRLPYCTRKLNWEVIMCPYNLKEPPDFVMEEEFLTEANFELVRNQVPSLLCWHPEDPKCLLHVVIELLQLYKLFQLSYQNNLFNNEDRMTLEYNALLRYTKTPLTDIELQIHNATRTSVLVHLNVDYTKLPIMLPKKKYPTLVMIELGENTKNTVSVVRMACFDGIFANLQLPPLQPNMLLVQYLPVVQKCLQERVEDIVWRLDERKSLFSSFIQVFGPAMLDYDNVSFRKFSFLLEYCGVFYVLKVQVPLKFPDYPPEVIVSSMRNRRSGIPLFLPLDKFKYCATWDADKIFNTMYDFIVRVAIPLYHKQILANSGL